ncbi:hypothetical protein BDV32DRAFT_132913 [Aspergillus pseudonomiae]|uniref:RmlC-like cupin domain-containing protein n=1 Tax=Aspergillus caelatus TaxID=61420 RepID=A0A5N6ZI29_9EURO|nr:uncharacterized protein BDV27DRAFT_139569 [Aspergillus caelatus]KAB8254133.1 hypothetical protein BDV32DRAFT_132913 [Aspergillus pseudonomiae]KAE8357302.1 hypothetical protein BDV27DRAFT_139569 [Aspergillus caelatus]
MNFWSLINALGLLSTLDAHCLTTTAIVEDENGIASLECWKFTQPLQKYPTIGMSLPLANVSNVTYVALPPRSGEGIHNPPHPMLFVLLSGLAHITLPNGADEAWVMEGVNGLLVAADTVGEGHYTDYPSDKTTVALQIPFENGIIPPHKIVHLGACKSPNQIISNDPGVELSFARLQYEL